MEELCKLIQDERLRSKVLLLLKEPKLSHHEFKRYPKAELEKASTPFSVGNWVVERDVLNHSIALARLCIKAAEVVKQSYGIELNCDHLIAAALLHDLMKLFEWQRVGDTLQHSGIMLDHSMLAVAELYKREFPEGVIHIVASHFGAAGPTPPRSYEALIFHYLDSMLSLLEYNFKLKEATKESNSST